MRFIYLKFISLISFQRYFGACDEIYILKIYFTYIISTLFWCSFLRASLMKFLVVSIVCKCINISGQTCKSQIGLNILNSNHKIPRGVMKKIFHPQTHNTHHTPRYFCDWNLKYFVSGKHSNSKYNEFKLLTFTKKIEESLNNL